MYRSFSGANFAFFDSLCCDGGGMVIVSVAIVESPRDGGRRTGTKIVSVIKYRYSNELDF